MKVVCVTGASGYIASWLVKFLLQRGYTVKASVRDLNDTNKTKHLLGLDGAKDKLQLFQANLLEKGSFDAAIDGCDGVFHTASPVILNEITDPQAELIDPAVKGTLNVLQSCAKSKSVKRVILTSSVAAMKSNGRPLTADVVIDESWWSVPKICEEMKLWYVLSKTLAEDAAWKFVKEKEIDMVSINPAMVIGPLLQPTLNASAATILQLINGSETYPNMTMVWVDVKDVANAHILAFENPLAYGRYCLCERVAYYSEIVEILRQLYPNIKLPENCRGDDVYATSLKQKIQDDTPELSPKYKCSQEKAKSLGVQFTAFEQSIKETVESLREKNFVTF